MDTTKWFKCCWAKDQTTLLQTRKDGHHFMAQHRYRVSLTLQSMYCNCTTTMRAFMSKMGLLIYDTLLYHMINCTVAYYLHFKA